MAKKLAGQIKIQVPAGKASPAPPVGPVLGQRGLNIMAFCKSFNAQTADLEPGTPCPTIISYYQDKSLSIQVKTAPASYYLKKAANLDSGASTPGRETIGSITTKQLQEIAELKMKDLNAVSVEGAMNIIMGSAKSLGIEVKG